MNIEHLYKLVMNRIKPAFYYPLARLCILFKPLEKDKYLCISMAGDNYGDNIKSLADYISKTDDKAEIVWAFTRKFRSVVKCDYKNVEIYSFRYYYHILTSKYILSNSRLNKRMLHKRKGQTYLQTWHGTALKRIGKDFKKKKMNWIQRMLTPKTFRFDVANTDMMISGSSFMTNIFRQKFEFKGPIYETGTPRNDVFFTHHPEIKEKVRKALGIGNDDYIILYAPTFRSADSLSYYDIDLEKIRDNWKPAKGKKCHFVVRLHPLILHQTKQLKRVIKYEYTDASFYPDMQELLYASDLLVTDYSSSMFDFMYLHKPIILYTPDWDTYGIGCYFKLEELPFIVISCNEEIKEKLDSYNDETYYSDIDKFIERIGSVERGDASKQIYEILKKQ
mgnify:CR=1 FL=1